MKLLPFWRPRVSDTVREPSTDDGRRGIVLGIDRLHWKRYGEGRRLVLAQRRHSNPPPHNSESDKKPSASGCFCVIYDVAFEAATCAGRRYGRTGPASNQRTSR